MLFLSVSLSIPFHEVRQWSAAEILLYQCYYRVSPWGEERADIRSAMRLSQTANMHRDSSKTPKPYEIDDFMPFREKPEPKETSEPVGLRDLFRTVARKK